MKKIFLILFILPLIFTSCTDYIGDTGTDQTNSPDFATITPNALLAGAITNYTRHQNITLADYGNKMAYVWGLNTGYTTVDPAYNYLYTSGDYNACFENTYLFGGNFQDIINKKDVFPNYDYHFGVAKIFKVMCMDYATALYGDVPYTDAFKGIKNPYPKYDDDKTIIPKLFVELDEAKAYFNTSNVDVIALGSEDVVFHGDVAKWLQFANTIELKLLMRLSKTTDPALVSLRTARAAMINLNQDFINQDVTVNPGYLFSGTIGQRTPVFRTYGRVEDFTDWSSSYYSNATGNYLNKILNGTLNNATLTTGLIDPRRARITNGIVGNDHGTFPPTTVARIPSFYTGRSAGDGLVATANKNACERDAFLMLNAESQFLQAEAIQRGYITGNAQQKFNDGITASFNFYSTGWGDLIGIIAPVSSVTTYITNTNLKNGLGWGGSADKINCIITQKYLALANWHGMELYLDNLRTGYPVLPLPVGIPATGVRPNRLIYPNSEYSSNGSNVPNVVGSDLFTVNSKTPYYLQ
jgi:hypothetical protein